MTNNIEALRTNVVSKIAQQYHLDITNLQYVGGFHNWVYEFQQDGVPLILRVSTEPFHSLERVKEEIDWIQYLWENNIPVARPLPLLAGQQMAEVEVEGNSYPVVVFQKALGTRSQAEDWNPDLFQQMGRLVGKMHAVTQHYQPHPSGRRPDWRESLTIMRQEFSSGTDPEVSRKMDELWNHFDTLPRDAHSYGLIHVDVHAGNFFIHEGKITLFDFDDCYYSWFVEDIAMACYYAVLVESRKGMAENFPRLFFDAFMNGYEKENHLEPHWLKEIPYFMKQREILMYMAIRSKGMMDHWFLEGRRERIINDVPFVDMKFV